MRILWEFFCGGGMARLGLGPDWACQFATDRDAAKAWAYIANFGADHFNGADVASLTLADLPPGRPDLVWASPQCKDVSAAGPRIGLNGKRSAAFWPWWSLMRQLIDAGRAPRVIVIENVDTLLGATPIDKAHWRFRIARQANVAQSEAETSRHLGDVG
jgi:DNA (cytosine-5)-methyltransferase 1